MKLNQNLQKAKDLFREKKIKHEINFKKCIQEPNKFEWKYFIYYESTVPPTAKKSQLNVMREKMAFARHGTSTWRIKKHF